MSQSQALRLGSRSITTIVATSLVGIIAFGWPLFAAPTSSVAAHATDAPWLFAIVVPLMLAVVVSSFTDGGM
ncbi:MAG: ECF transporter S component, partial [Actinobacteria bacterium]|nr:ECF transporter S component [Actinomycetota bacterium]